MHECHLFKKGGNVKYQEKKKIELSFFAIYIYIYIILLSGYGRNFAMFYQR